MSTLFHVRLDVRKVQDYIFQVPKLKFMVGANSLVGELFSDVLPSLMEVSESVFCTDTLNRLRDTRLKENLQRNILSSSGGHFEAVFDTYAKLQRFIDESYRKIAEILPGLEYSISWREFLSSNTLAEFLATRANSVCGSGVDTHWFDLPYFELCDWDGISCASYIDFDPNGKKVKLGLKSKVMIDQAERFYKLETNDAISALYRSLKIQEGQLAINLSDLSKCGKSLKRNMLAYVKIDGNGTGDRFTKTRNNLESKNVLEAFIRIEEFWAQNRQKIWDSLTKTLGSTTVTKHYGQKLPYLLLMLGGDDLFLVCIPELALFIATSMADNMSNEYPISAGIAYVKNSYPIALANQLAESCLDSAKAGSYRDPGKPAFIDWHVHFDSAFQDIPAIRKNAYMMHYHSEEKEITEILCLRPYSLTHSMIILKEVEDMATMLDDPKKETANNKVKGYRSVVKNGKHEIDYFTRMILSDEQELKTFMGDYTQVCDPAGNEILLNSALDKIELLEFYMKQKDKEEVSCKG